MHRVREELWGDVGVYNSVKRAMCMGMRIKEESWADNQDKMH
jgi:hypothetical protein